MTCHLLAHRKMCICETNKDCELIVLNTDFTTLPQVSRLRLSSVKHFLIFSLDLTQLGRAITAR